MVLFMVVGPLTTVYADDEETPAIRRFRWVQTDKGFQVSARLHKGINQDIEEMIDAGIPTTFEFFIALKMKRWYWDSKSLSKAEYFHTVTYDTLRKIYTVSKTRHGDPNPFIVQRTTDVAEMREMLCSFEGRLHYARKDMTPGKDYYVSIRAVMSSEKLPPPFDSLFFFVSQTFETRTYRQAVRVD